MDRSFAVAIVARGIDRNKQAGPVFFRR
jgi:hypothetical protein